MVTVMYTCPRCGQSHGAQAPAAGTDRDTEVACPVCGTGMQPVTRVCECGKELKGYG
jgi:DNA-directed RNA polymerase subunit RPC12/RpoP